MSLPDNPFVRPYVNKAIKPKSRQPPPYWHPSARPQDVEANNTNLNEPSPWALSDSRYPVPPAPSPSHPPSYTSKPQVTAPTGYEPPVARFESDFSEVNKYANRKLNLWHPVYGWRNTRTEWERGNRGRVMRHLLLSMLLGAALGGIAGVVIYYFRTREYER